MPFSKVVRKAAGSIALTWTDSPPEAEAVVACVWWGRFPVRGQEAFWKEVGWVLVYVWVVQKPAGIGKM